TPLSAPASRMNRQTRATSAASAATFPAQAESSQIWATNPASATRIAAGTTPGAGQRRPTGAVVAVRTAARGEIAVAVRARGRAATDRKSVVEGKRGGGGGRRARR